MGVLDKLKRKSATARIAEELLYEQVALELGQGIRREGLWAKAFANSGGGDEKTRALYIRYRVRSLIDEAEIAGSLSEQTVSRSPRFKKTPHRTHADVQDLACEQALPEGATIYICDQCKSLNTQPGKCQRCGATLPL